MTVSPSIASAAKSGRVLIIGATGFIGKFVAEASLDSGLPTYVLVRPGPSRPSKSDTIKSLKDRGAIILHVRSSILKPTTPYLTWQNRHQFRTLKTTYIQFCY